MSVAYESHQVPPRRRRRSALTGVLVVLTAVAVLGATVAVWVHSTLLDTSRFVETVQPAVTDDAVTDAVATEVTTLVFDLVDVEGRIAAGLGAVDDVVGERLDARVGSGSVAGRLRDAVDVPTLASLAPILADELYERVEARVVDRLRSEDVREALLATVETTHRLIVAIVRGDETALPPSVAVGDDVRLDLVPVVARVLVEISDELAGFVDLRGVVDRATTDPHRTVAAVARITGTTVPEDFGQVVVVPEERLDAARTAVERFDRLVLWLVVLAIALLLLTVATAQRRVRATAWLGIAVLAAFGASVLVMRRLEEVVIDLVEPETREAAEAVLGATVSSIHEVGLVVAVAAVVALAGAVLFGWVGRSRPAPG